MVFITFIFAHANWNWNSEGTLMNDFRGLGTRSWFLIDGFQNATRTSQSKFCAHFPQKIGKVLVVFFQNWCLYSAELKSISRSWETKWRWMEAPAQGAISAASFVKRMEFAKSCFDLWFMLSNYIPYICTYMGYMGLTNINVERKEKWAK